MSSPPLLWKKIRRGLSAGRVQSVATRLVVEREEEIRAFVPKEYWTVEAQLERVAPNLGSFKAQFYGREKKMELGSQEEAQVVMDAVGRGSWSVAKVRRQEKNRQPAPPFTTSTLQQEASRKLNMSPARTMSIAQQLYEGGGAHRPGLGGSDHLYAYRLPAPVRGGGVRRPELHLRPVREGLLPPPGAGSTRQRATPRTPTRPSGPPT